MLLVLRLPCLSTASTRTNVTSPCTPVTDSVTFFVLPDAIVVHDPASCRCWSVQRLRPDPYVSSCTVACTSKSNVADTSVEIAGTAPHEIVGGVKSWRISGYRFGIVSTQGLAFEQGLARQMLYTTKS